MLRGGEMERADSVWSNGRIYVVDKAFSVCEAIAVKDGRIIFAGTSDEAQKFVGAGTAVTDLNGRVVLPGLNDAHLHFHYLGETKMRVDCYWKSKDDILRLVREAAAKAGCGEWVLGWGWNQMVWDPPIFPTKDDLDAAAPDVPVALERTCEHMTWLNSRAMEAVGISENIANPVGGEFLRDSEGRLNGLVTDNAQNCVVDAEPKLTEAQDFEALLLAQNELFKFGITSATDAGTDLDIIERMKKLYSQGKLKIRLDVMVRRGMNKSPKFIIEQTREWLAKGKEVGLFDNRMQVRCLKISADGSLGGRSAWMLEDYNDRAGHRGNGKLSDDELYTLVSEAHRAGMQVSVHAIGDAANRQVLDIYERVLTEAPKKDHRFRIEHAQIVNKNDFNRFMELGVLPSMQTVHGASDMNMAEERIGAERLEYSYAWRKFLDAGAIIPNGTDTPVESPDPWINLYAAVTRKDKNGKRRPGWNAEDAMTREEALCSYTIWPAYASFEEDFKGSLEVGKAADFIVTDKDFMTCDAEDIPHIKVLRTVLNGDTVYDSGCAEG